MNVKKGSKVGLLFADGSSIDYEVREPVSLDHLINTLLRLASLGAPAADVEIRRHDA